MCYRIYKKKWQFQGELKIREQTFEELEIVFIFFA